MQATKPVLIEPIDDEGCALSPPLSTAVTRGYGYHNNNGSGVSYFGNPNLLDNQRQQQQDLSSAVDTVYHAMDQSRYLASCVIAAEAARVNKRLINHQQQQVRSLTQSSNKKRKLLHNVNKAKEEKTPEDGPEDDATVSTDKDQVSVTDMQQQQQQETEASSSKSTSGQRNPDEILLYQQASRSHRMIQLFQQLEHIQGCLMDEMMACADDAEIRRSSRQDTSSS